MVKFYFIRHGETVSNTLHTLQGWSDTPLTENGINQAKALGKGLLETPFLKAYVSPSRRTYHTSCYILQNRDIDIIPYFGLKEMNFGSLETKPNTFPGCESYVERVLYDWASVGGETMDSLTSRMKNTLEYLVEQNGNVDGNIMCVTHGLAILALIRCIDEDLYKKLLYEEIRFGNCCVNVISYEDGKFLIEDINNIEYVNNGMML